MWRRLDQRRPIDDRRGDRPILNLINVEAQLPMLTDDELRQMRFWEEENFFRPGDTSLYFFNSEAMDDELAAFYQNSAWQSLRTWVSDNGLQYVKLKKSPGGYLGSTRLIEYMDKQPYMRVLHPPGVDGGGE